MSFFDDLISKLLAKLLTEAENLLRPVLGPFKAVLNLIDQFTSRTANIFSFGQEIFTEAVTEYQAIKDFKMPDNWSSRVMSVPQAVDTVKRLSDVPGQLVGAFKDLIQQLKDSFPDTSVAATEELESFEGASDLTDLLSKFGGKVEEVGGKILEWAGLLLQALIQIEAVMQDVKTILDAVKEVRQDFENFDGFFLGQSNPRIKAKLVLENGQEKFISLRDGHLHASLDTSAD